MRPGILALLLRTSVALGTGVLCGCGRPSEEVIILDRDERPAARLHRTGDVKDGPVLLYWPTGQVRVEGCYDRDRRTGWWGTSHPDGHRRSWTHYRNGLKDGLRVHWDSTGRTMRSERFVKGKHNGLFIRRFPDGRIAERSTYVDDLLEGPHIQWYDDRGGSVVMGSYHKDLAQGLWTEYDTTGRSIWQGYFNAGVVERMVYGKRRKH